MFMAKMISGNSKEEIKMFVVIENTSWKNENEVFESENLCCSRDIFKTFEEAKNAAISLNTYRSHSHEYLKISETSCQYEFVNSTHISEFRVAELKYV